ncbi:MAG: CPBP family intramembrane metalloprotease [Deltaproteobacteria bacterium]|nr:CPBP family intramembrane metalloprotease [Deltaproteobacteria bacterium]
MTQGSTLLCPAAARGKSKPRGGCRRGKASVSAALLAFFFLLGAPTPARAVNPDLAAASSLLLPGLGQYMNHDWAAGAVQMGLTFSLAGHYFDLTESPEYIKPENQEDSATHTLRMNRTTFKASFYGAALNGVNLYSAFGAYRDARANPAYAARYTVPAPQETLTDLVLAPFNPDHLLRWTTILPLSLPLYIAFSKATPDTWVIQPDADITRTEMRRGYPVMMGFVAVGEESFFRGYLNNSLSNWLGPTWGLVTSSAFFGLAHSGQAGTANRGMAFAYGLYLGALQQMNDYGIGQGVAIHYWWNTLVSLALLKERPTAQVTLMDLYFQF